MTLYETYFKEKIVVQEYAPLEIPALFLRKGTSRRIPPGAQKDITPMAMQLRPFNDFWGCQYEVIAHADPWETGTLRMRAHSAFAWGLVYNQEERMLVACMGSHTFSIAPPPFGNKFFLFAHRTMEGAVVDKVLEWKPQHYMRRGK